MKRKPHRSAPARRSGAAGPSTANAAAPRAAPPSGSGAAPAALAVAGPAEEAPARYDPADYRWVPVRRRPRLDGWTEEKQRRFIETLADTGLVNVAASEVGMSRASAYQLRRSAHGAAFARAWDAARHHAAGLIEDIAFERAIEGTEQEVFNREGEVVGTRLVHDNRLLKYLLSHLKPERYGGPRGAGAGANAGGSTDRPAADASGAGAIPVAALHETLRAMEPALPAPPEQLLDADTLAQELALADVADGALPRFLREQPVPKSADRLAAEEASARDRRGTAALAKYDAGGALTAAELADACYHLDPVSNLDPRPRQRRPAPGG